MPKRLIHSGREFHLIPMKSGTSVEEPDHGDSDGKPVKSYPDGKCSPECHGGHLISGEGEVGIDYAWEAGWPHQATKDDGVILDQEPSAFIAWSKGREPDGGGEDPGDVGYASIIFEVTPQYLRRLVRGLDNWSPDVPKPDKLRIESGPLSWRDLNELAKVAITSRDDAFNKPA